jgi:ATP-dependent Clp protease ATP-binding subunit ClpA
MFERFAREARDTVHDAQGIARELGAPAIEAEHLLLALARRGDPALAAEGLDYDGVLGALERETERSLAAVGISADPLPASPSLRKPGFARSAKSAIEGSLREAVRRGDKAIASRHLLLALLAPARGTVPRALEAAGVDREALRRRL